MATGQYDDAWETPGWTAQNLSYPPSDEQVVTAPAGLKNIDVVGTFFDQRSRPEWGVFTFTPSVRIVRVHDVTVVLKPFRAQLRNGQLTDVTILSPDDLSVSPPSWSWHVKQRVGPTTREYDLAVPIAGDTIDVKDSQIDTTLVTEFPLPRDYTIVEGATFRREFTWTQPGGSPDLTTWTAKMQIRTAVGGALLLELTETSGITLTADGGIKILITAEQTLNLTNGVYDLELYEPGPDGDTIRFLEGSITVSPNVTE